MEIYTQRIGRAKETAGMKNVVLMQTKRLKYQHILKKYKDELNITSKENELSSYNSKSCNMTKYNDFITKKINTNDVLYKLYQNNKFRQYK